jgi:hypothetical protein
MNATLISRTRDTPNPIEKCSRPPKIVYEGMIVNNGFVLKRM